MKIIEKEWNEYVTSVFNGATISKTQYQEMRRTFIAGFLSSFYIFVGKMPDLPMNEVEALIQQLKNELMDYKKEVQLRIDTGE